MDYPIFKFANTDVDFLVVPRAVQDIVSGVARSKGWKLKCFEDETGPSRSTPKHQCSLQSMASSFRHRLHELFVRIR